MSKLEATPVLPLIILREARTPGAWGKGATAAEAAKAIRQHGARDGTTVYGMACSADAFIDEMGALQHNGRGPILKGKLYARGIAAAELYAEAQPTVEA